MTNVALFADVSNLYYCINKRFDRQKLDYGKLREKAATFGALSRSFAYGSQIADEAVNFITYLKRLGYDTKYKKLKASATEDREKVKRADWKLGIAMDVVPIVTNRNCDAVILATSDPEMAPLLAWLKSQGTRCIVMACGIPKELRELADQFIEIDAEFLEVKEEAA